MYNNPYSANAVFHLVLGPTKIILRSQSKKTKSKNPLKKKKKKKVLLLVVSCFYSYRPLNWLNCNWTG